MHIHYLANIRFPSERAHAAQIAHMAEALSSLATVTLIVTNRADKERAQFPTDYFGFVPTFAVKKIPSWSLAYTAKFFYYLNSVWFTVQYRLRHYNSTALLYCRDEILIALLLLFFVPTKQLVFESHEAKLNWPARFLLQRGVKTVVISDAIRDDYLDHGIPESQLLVAYDGIDESFFSAVATKAEARTRLGLALNDAIAMYIGGFDTWKGIDTFCTAAEHSDKQFVVIGGSSTQVAHYSQRFPKVRFLGAKPYRELKDHQQAADVLVVPNGAASPLGARYTSPLKLFAHMASGVPLIITDVPSLVSVTGREVVTVTKPDNPVALARAIDLVCEQYERAVHQALRLKDTSRQYVWLERAKKIMAFCVASPK